MTDVISAGLLGESAYGDRRANAETTAFENVDAAEEASEIPVRRRE